MELNYLFEFMALAKYQNYHAAADALEISQSALTNHIKVLEKELNVSLFDRNTRKVALNEYGKVFYPFAESYTELYNNCIQAINLKRYNDKIVLTVAIEPHYMVGDLIKIFNDFQKENKNIIIEFFNAPIYGARKLLRCGRCNMVFLPQATSADMEFRTLNIRMERAVAIVKKDHPFASRQEIDIAELRDESLFVPPKRSILYDLLTSACEAAGFEPNIGCLGASEQTAMILTRQGLGISILSDYSAERIINDSMRIVNISPELKWYVNLLFADSRSFARAQSLVNYIYDASLNTGND